jgi:DNA-binding NtrC family response regulator
MDEEQDGGAVVVVHDDSDVADLLTGLLRANGFQTKWCRSHGEAEERLATSRDDLVIVPWDRPIGKQVYRWASKSSTLRRRFVFIVDEIPPDLVRAAARQRVARLTDLEAVLYAVVSTRRRLRARPAGTRPPPYAAPKLLLVEDDPDQLAAMSELLRALGYDVVTASGVQAAELVFEASAVDAVLSDWCMTDGTGAELYRWISERRPDFLGAVVFITGGDVAAARASVTPALVLPKGQDSRELITALSRAIELGKRVRNLERPGEREEKRVLPARRAELDTERKARLRAPEGQRDRGRAGRVV